MSDQYPFPGMAHVPAPTNSINPTPPPAVNADPQREDRRAALEVAAVFLQGTGETNSSFLEAADQIARYLKDGIIRHES